jgi:hypothetical protein
VCNGRACWRATGTGFVYADRELTPNGLKRIRLRAGDARRAVIVLSGKGQNLMLPPLLSLTTPLRVQLQAANGQCWEATYSTPLVSTGEEFRATSD